MALGKASRGIWSRAREEPTWSGVKYLGPKRPLTLRGEPGPPWIEL